jgi:TrmH family RNA methyltransferase
MRITSPDNPLVRRLRRLADSPRACRESGRSIAEGLHLVECALQAAAEISTIVISEDANPAARELAERAAALRSQRVVELARVLYDTIAPVEHGVGLLVEVGIPRPALPASTGADAIYLDGIQDPGNAGTLLRTAAAAAVRHVAASTGTAFLWAPKVLRASMGAHFRLSIYEDVAADQLPRAFIGERLAADADGVDSVYADMWGPGPTVWMFGSEGCGLSPAASNVAQRRLRIPIAAGVDSLNVAAAAAVCLFEQRRRRG